MLFLYDQVQVIKLQFFHFPNLWEKVRIFDKNKITDFGIRVRPYFPFYSVVREYKGIKSTNDSNNVVGFGLAVSISINDFEGCSYIRLWNTGKRVLD